MNKNLMSTRMKNAVKFLGGLALLSSVSSADAAVKALSVSGNKILADGQAASFSGNSLFWSNDGWGGEKYYTAGTVNWLKTDWKSNLVRAAMGVEESGGYLGNPASNLAKVKAVVNAAIANDMYVIIDWHTHHAEQYQSQAIAFFQEMARTYGNNNNVIYEVYNEPLDTASWSGTIKPYAQAVTNAIRAIDPDNLIIVGTRTWSQRVDEAANDPISGKNVAYTLHFYAGSHGQWLRDTAQTALNKNVAIFVTEWGSVNADGNGGVNYSETNAWVSWMKQNNISNANWALNDKAEGASALTAGASGNGGWTSNQLTASGAFAKDIIYNWGGNTSGGSSSSSSSSVASYAVGAQIEAEGFSNMSGVQTETTSDTGGGQNVGYIDSGDWMTYPINVPTAGTYKISYRVASMNGGGILGFEKAGGTPVYATTNIPSTGGWQTWVTITQVVDLPAGDQTFALSAKTGGFNVNWLRLDPVSTSSSSSSSSSNNTTPIATIQAESYAVMSGVQTETTTDTGGGLNVGYIDSGDWMSYTSNAVTVPSTGTYTIQFRVASAVGGGVISFEEAGGTPVYGTVSVPNTGGWQNWTTVKLTVNLTAGTHKFGIKAAAGGFNVNWFSVTAGAI